MAVPQHCKLVNKNGLLLLVMPGGTIIPLEGEITRKQDIVFGNNKKCKVSVEFPVVDVEHDGIEENEIKKLQ
jgi:hypothetical protein